MKSSTITRKGTERLQIVFLLPTLDIGGAERVVLRTAAGLDPARFNATILAFCRGTGRLAAEARDAGVSARSLSEHNQRSPRLAWQLFTRLRRDTPDVLVSYMFHANLAARVVGRLAGVRWIICSERVVGWESQVRIVINRVTRRLADAVTTNSAAGVRFWAQRLKVPMDGIRLIYNGVDTNRFQPRVHTPREPLVVGTLARLHVANGHETLLAALKHLNSLEVGAWQCVIGGDGQQAARLLAFSREAGLTSRVSFLGHVSSPGDFLQNLDIYVQPSLVAGMSNAVLEAMASGIPVVATDVGGTSEVIEDGKTGVLVRPRDPERMCAAIAFLLRDAQARASMGRAARERIRERFSVERMVSDTAALIEEVVAAHGGRRN